MRARPMGMSSSPQPPVMANPMSMQLSAEAARITASRADLVVLAAASLGHALGVAGDRAGARAVLDRLLQRRAHEYVSPYDLALVYAGLGDKDKALDWLQRAYQERSSLLVFAPREPRLAPLRTAFRGADAGFRAPAVTAPSSAFRSMLAPRRLQTCRFSSSRLVLGRVSYMTLDTTIPETKVSAAMVTIAKGMVNASAKSPAAIAPIA